MSDLTQALRAELSAIEVDVAKLEAGAATIQARLRLSLDKADKVKALLALYANESVGVEPAPQLFVPPVLKADEPPRSHRPPATRRSKAAQIKAEVTDLLSARGTEHRQKILDHLIAKGLMGHEKAPLASLAAYLSENKDTFVADGRGNFSLRRESRTEPAPALPISVGYAEARHIHAPSIPNEDAVEGGVS